MFSYQDKKNIFEQLEKILELNKDNKKKDFVENIINILNHDEKNKSFIILKNNGYYIKFNALSEDTLTEINEYISDIVANHFIIY